MPNRTPPRPTAPVPVVEPAAVLPVAATVPVAARRRRRPTGDDGMTTAEYAVGTVAACGFAAILWTVLHSGAVTGALENLVVRALHLL